MLSKSSLVAFCFCLQGLSACVTVVYQPLSALRQPVGVDLSKKNFENYKIQLTCRSGSLLEADEADELCRNISAQFARQGAVTNFTQANRDNSESDESSTPPSVAPLKPAIKNAATMQTPLTVELSAKRVRVMKSPWLGVLFFYSLSLIPYVEDLTDEQRIVVRDENGFLLADQTFQIRIIEYTGVGYFVLNAIANRLFRSDDEQISDGTASELMTKDLHRQICQVVLNAGTRRMAMKFATSPDSGSK